MTESQESPGAHATVVAEDVPGIRSALTRYRIVAWVVGTLLVLLVCVAMPLKYLGDDPRLVTWIGIPHGWLYALLLLVAYDVGRRVHWSWKRLLYIALSGLVPFLTFFAEHAATKDVRRRVAEVSPGGPAQR